MADGRAYRRISAGEINGAGDMAARLRVDAYYVRLAGSIHAGREEITHAAALPPALETQSDGNCGATDLSAGPINGRGG